MTLISIWRRNKNCQCYCLIILMTMPQKSKQWIKMITVTLKKCLFYVNRVIECQISNSLTCQTRLTCPQIHRRRLQLWYYKAYRGTLIKGECCENNVRRFKFFFFTMAQSFWKWPTFFRLSGPLAQCFQNLGRYLPLSSPLTTSLIFMDTLVLMQMAIIKILLVVELRATNTPSIIQAYYSL